MLLLTLLAAFIPATLAVKCFTCSWSPKDAPNRTVMCSDTLFEGDAVAIADCEHGCQTYFHMDNNGVLEQLRRSCLQSKEDLSEECITEENKAFTSRRCTCNYSLCNSATAAYASSITGLLMAVSVIIHWAHTSCRTLV